MAESVESSNTAIFAITLALLYIIGRPVYELFFSPLKDYPGPLLWRAFRLPQLWIMISGKLPFKLKELHDRYGPVVRIAPNELSFIDSAAWKDIYSKQHLVRPPQWRGRLPNKNSDHFISADVETHARFRRVFQSAFSEQAIRRQEDLMQRYISRFLSRCSETIEGSKEAIGIVDLVKLLTFTTFDIVGDLGWGQSFGCLEKMQYHPWVEIILQFKMTEFAAALKYYPWIDKLMAVLTPASAIESIKMIITTAEKNVEARLSMDHDRPDIISYAIKQNMRSNSDPNHITIEEMETNSMAFIVAGSDSTASALAAAINCLLKSPQSAERLVGEVRGAFTSEDQIDSISTGKLRYLKAVIEEALRMYPPVPDIMRRQVAGGNITVAGHRIPNGTVVGIPQWAMFHSSRNFEHHDKFLPDRWLGDLTNTTERPKDDRSAFQPFSMGPTGCIGHALARMELRIILARFVWRFNFDIPKGEKCLEWTEQKVWWSWQKEPLRVALTRA